MSGNQIQPTGRDAIELYTEPSAPQEWGGGQEPVAPSGAPKFGRYLSALGRFKWLVILLGFIGAGVGYAGTKLIDPEFEVQSRIMLEMGTGTSDGSGGPVQANKLLQESGWEDLLRSYTVSDYVVNQLSLFVKPTRDADSLLFRSFRVAPALTPGEYVLAIAGNSYILTLKPGMEIERGALADSIGRKVGFQWRPGAEAFAGRGKEIEFKVETPREASRALIRKLNMTLNDGSSFLLLTLTGENPSRTARTLNTWVEQFVAVASALKKRNVTSYASILEGQREYAAENLTSAEAALQSFSVRTATEPTERQSSIAGVERTTNPAFDAYFRDKILAENYRKDREAIERLLANENGGLTRDALLSIPAIATDPAAEDLRNALKEQSDREFSLRRLRETLQDENQRIKTEVEALAQLKNAVVPRNVTQYLNQLKLREQQLGASIEISGKDLRGIPTRTIEEQRLKRQVDVAAEMYRSLDLEAAKAKLAEAATIPDVSVLDSAVAPLKPTRNTAPVIILGAIGIALGLGIFIAILLDQLDKRFRYPEQATDDLGLFILGVVADIRGAKTANSTDTAAQVVEAFRTIRMNVRYAADPTRPMMMTITSPGPGDGKSLISSNLALSFAESGARTLLIDGDMRRGELAKTFGIDPKPGLVEVLDGTALISEVLNPASSHPNLTVVPSGARRRRAPELLATPRLSQLLNQLASEYDVIIVDSPPLGAGFDAYALATATGNMALVLRSGVTDRKMAAAKMAVIDTLPVRVMGAVLNGVKLGGVYEYYSYYDDYDAADEAPVKQLESSGPARGALQPVERS
ncbi:MAG: polysaccharide biosynthesis tyrosine autokinase [Gemmatimonadaceae bacterium]|nr:polysaccharide biosynthesis tyrosine autokinase [Gemmatimonadaceae bacterium]